MYCPKMGLASSTARKSVSWSGVLTRANSNIRKVKPLLGESFRFEAFRTLAGAARACASQRPALHPAQNNAPARLLRGGKGHFPSPGYQRLSSHPHPRRSGRGRMGIFCPRLRTGRAVAEPAQRRLFAVSARQQARAFHNGESAGARLLLCLVQISELPQRRAPRMQGGLSRRVSAAVDHALGFVECVLLAMARPRRNR